MRLADVISSERVTEEGAPYLRVKLDPIDTITVPSFDAAGEDSPPLPGDKAVCDDDHCVGFADVKNAGAALPGEKRMYARDENGTVVGVLYMKRDGTLELGLNPTDYVARASRTDAEIERLSNEMDALTTAFNSHTHMHAPGPGAPVPTAPPVPTASAPGSPQPVGSETVKVQP